MKKFYKFFLVNLLFLIFISVPKILCASPSEALHKAFEDGIAHAGYYETPQGHQLRYAHFKSPVEGAKDTVFFLQGRGTFLEFYEVLVVPLLERGLDVWMYDLSGQGGSTRLVSSEHHDEETAQCMQHVESFDLYLDDAHAFIQNAVLPNVEGRLFLGGYSTGGHIALRYLQTYPDTPFEAVFVISPLLALKAPVSHTVMSYLFWSASMLVNWEIYAPGAGHEDPIFKMLFEGNPYTGNESSYQDMQNLCTHYKQFMMGGVSLGWVKAVLDSLTCLWKDSAIRTINIPVLIATGQADGVVDVSYNEQFANRLTHPHNSHVSYVEGRHELFRETPEIHKIWWEDFDLFLISLK